MYDESEEIDLFKVRPKPVATRDPRLDERLKIWDRQSRACAKCATGIECKPTKTRIGVQDMPTGELDHVVPRYVGRIYPQYEPIVSSADNLQLLCLPCHKAKTRNDTRIRTELGPRTVRELSGRPPLSWNRPGRPIRDKKPVSWLVEIFGLPHIENNST